MTGGCPLLDDLRATRAYLRALKRETQQRLVRGTIVGRALLDLHREVDLIDAILAGRAKRKESWQ